MNFPYILCFTICIPLSVLATTFRDQQNLQIIQSINSALNYYINNHDEISGNVIVGVLITKGRLLKFSRINGVGEILDKCTLIMEVIYPLKWATTPYAKKYMKKLSEIMPQRFLEYSSAITYEPLFSSVHGHPTVNESNECIFDTMLTFGYAPDKCDSIMLDPTAIGFTLTHQMLYFSIKFSLFPEQELNYKEQICSRKCSKMLAEFNVLKPVAKIYSELCDLIMEQIIFCVEYKNFTNNENLEMIFDLQTSNGCFMFHSSPGIITNTTCNNHLSSVAMGALASYFWVLNG